MKVLIPYHSETGNTEKIVRAIYGEASKKAETLICSQQKKKAKGVSSLH